MSEMCECGHSQDDHDSDDEGELGCSKCDCPGFYEMDDDTIESELKD